MIPPKEKRGGMKKGKVNGFEEDLTGEVKG
jgi:hypothetical protein